MVNLWFTITHSIILSIICPYFCQFSDFFNNLFPNLVNGLKNTNSYTLCVLIDFFHFLFSLKLPQSRFHFIEKDVFKLLLECFKLGDAKAKISVCKCLEEVLRSRDKLLINQISNSSTIELLVKYLIRRKYHSNIICSCILNILQITAKSSISELLQYFDEIKTIPGAGPLIGILIDFEETNSAQETEDQLSETDNSLTHEISSQPTDKVSPHSDLLDELLKDFEDDEENECEITIDDQEPPAKKQKFVF